jgi:hypothetical protein
MINGNDVGKPTAVKADEHNMETSVVTKKGRFEISSAWDIVDDLFTVGR